LLRTKKELAMNDKFFPQAVKMFFALVLVTGLSLPVNPTLALPQNNAPLADIDEPNDALYGNQWHFHGTYGINAPMAWGVTTGNASTVVAVLDTGITSHEDLDEDRILQGYDFVSAANNDGDDGRDSNPSDPGDYDGGSCATSSWQGTHVAGIIGAKSDNTIGVAGIDWLAKILPVRVIGTCGSAAADDIVDGMRWAADLPVDGEEDGPVENAYPADVIHVSASIPGLACTAYQADIDAIIASGAVIVAPAGDGSTTTNNFPSNCNGVITVAATDAWGDKADYSNYGSTVEISAPGGGNAQGDVLSTTNSGTTNPEADPVSNSIYTEKTGTAMAAAHVSGVVSLMFAANPLITPAQVSTILQKTAKAFPSASCTPSTCGWGIVDAGEAVRVANMPDLVITDVTLSPTNTPYFGQEFQVNITVKNQGGLNLHELNANGAVSGQVYVGRDPSLIPKNDLGCVGINMPDGDDLGEFGRKDNNAPIASGASAVVVVGINNPSEPVVANRNPWPDPFTLSRYYDGSSESRTLRWGDGTHDLYVYVDANCNVEESFENNNYHADSNSNPIAVTSNPFTEEDSLLYPVFKWNKVEDAAQYEVIAYKQALVKNKKTGKWVNTNVYMINQSFTQDQACKAGTLLCSVSAGPTVPFASGIYYWQMRHVTTTGVYGPWSDLITFTVELPGVTLISPVDGAAGYIVRGDPAIPDYKPTFRWSKDSIATDYYLNVAGPNVYNTKTKKWVANTVVSKSVKSAAVCNAETNVCSWESPVSLGANTYSWSVTPKSPGGNGLAVSGTFNTSLIPPGEVSRTSPEDAASGYIEDAGGSREYAPEFKWTADPIATQYYVKVVGPPVYNSKLRKWVPNTVVSQWVMPEACVAGECSLQGPRLGGGAYSWSVQAYTPAGYGPLPVADPYGYFNISTTLPGEVTRISPDDAASGYIENAGGLPEYAPKFEWNADPIATDYYVNVVGPPVYNKKTRKWVPNTVVSRLVTREDACESGTCSLQGPRLGGGAYSWYVKAYTPAGYGPLPVVDPYGTFNINTTPPDGVDLIEPNGGTNGDYTPVFKWTKSLMATDYSVNVAGPPVYNSKTKKWVPNTVFAQWVTSEEACNEPDTCSLQGPTLPAMDYTWHVIPSSPAGLGPILEYGAFNPIAAVPDPVTLTAPVNGTLTGYIVEGDPATGTIPEYAPEYEWTAVSSATQYYVYVAGPPVYNSKTRKWVANPVVSKSVKSEDACVSGTCSLQGPALSAATYTWYVQAFNPSGGSTTTPGNFNTSTLLPPAVTDLIYPAPIPPDPMESLVNIGFDYNPTYQWERVEGATQYLVYIPGPPVYNKKTRKWVANPVLNKWFPADTYCDDTTCSVPKAQSPTLGGSTYTWQVRAYSPAGYTDWSPAVTFSPNAQTPPPAVSGMRVNGVPNDNPKDKPIFTWQKVNVATSYRVYVSGTNGVMLDTWVTSVNACPGNVCAVEMPATLAADKYNWWVQSYNVLGYGPWRKSTFSVLKAPAATTGLSPTGTTTDTRPDFSWAKVDNSSLYRLYVRGLNGTVVLDESYQASSICTGATCSITSPIDFDSGDYVWSVMTYNDAAGYGPWKSAELHIQ
jgi:hypothetical protein